MPDTDLDIAWSESCCGQSRKALERLRALSAQRDAQADAQKVCRCEWLIGWALFMLGEFDEAFGHAQRAMSLAAHLDDATQARTAALCGWMLPNLGLSDEGYAAATAAVEAAERSGDAWARVFALHVLAMAIWLGGDVASAAPVSEQALAGARAIGDTHLESWILVNLACMTIDVANEARASGDEATFVHGHEQAIALTCLASNLAKANSYRWVRRIALSNMAEFLAYLGRFDEARRYLEAWKEVGGDITNRRLVHHMEAQAELLRLEGRLDEARECGEKALALAERESIMDMISISTRVLSDIHEARGDFEMALKLFKRFRQLEIRFEGEKAKRREMVAAVIYEAEKHRTLAATERAKAEQSERDAATDALTGVANRRAMERSFDAMLARGTDDFAVVFADLDHFKAVNDRYSHAVGDEVIKAFAKILQSCCRPGGLVARIGGEEFVLLLDQKIDACAATVVCDHILTKTRGYAWSQIAPGLSMTVSLGLVRGGEVQGREALLALADARLYRAKENGRDSAVTEGDFKGQRAIRVNENSVAMRVVCGTTLSYPELEEAWRECGCGQARKALERLRQCSTRIKAQGDARAACRCEWLMGWTLFQLGETEEAFGHAQQARAIAERLDDAAKARAQALCAWGFTFMGLGDESFAAASLAASIAESCGDDWTHAFVQYILSDTIRSGGDGVGALPVYERALAEARQVGDTRLESWILIGLACMIGDIADAEKAGGDQAAFVKEYEEAIAQTSRACNLAKANSDSWAQRIALANNADLYANIGRFDEAYRCLDAWTEVGGDIVSRREVHFLEVRAGILRLEGRLDEAREHGERALALAKSESVVDMIHLCTRALSEIHEARGEFELALKLYKRFRQLLIQFEGEKVKRRARVAAVIDEAEKSRTLAATERAKAEQSERDAATDALTGVGNRRAMERSFDATLARGADDFAVIFADLDHFKAVNDRYSHAVGDEVIKAFAKILQSCCRPGGLVARIGGEEFVLLLDQKIDACAATTVCDHILTKTRGYAWSQIAPGLSMTVSLGLVRGGEVQGREALLALADARLYCAKESGRDRAVTDGCLASMMQGKAHQRRQAPTPDERQPSWHGPEGAELPQ